MSSTWVVGDIHGCSEELEELVEGLNLGPTDKLISVGDLYHRGPDPVGVVDVLSSVKNFSLVLGNHELAMLKRNNLDGDLPDGSDFGVLSDEVEVLEAEFLLGDGGTAMAPVPPARSVDLVRFLEGHSFFLQGEAAERTWWIVHAGLVPGRKPEECTPFELARMRRIHSSQESPFWYEVYEGPELVIFGHTPSQLPRTRYAGENLVALGLDTGCVYGGCLTAYCVEDDEFYTVTAKRDWAS
ncbi:MAG TPA: hypothetical protein DDW23_03100 [Planctomycetes bacterium]|nr:hypothetical protein [Planctomycetota bacterium]